MSAHFFLNLLNKLGKRDKNYKFNNYRSTNDRFYLSYDIKIILKSYLGVKRLGVCHMHDVKCVIS